MVIGEHTTRLDLRVDFTFTLFEHYTLFSCAQHAGVEQPYSVVEGGVTPIHGWERKGNCCVGVIVPHMCVLDPPGQVNKLDLNRPPLTA